MQDLKITLVQADLVWENITANLERFDEIVNGISEETDLILLPEMFSTGFSMTAAQHAEEMDGSAVRWIKGKAVAKGVDIAGSLMIRENDLFYNRFLWARPDGEILTYDKRHLFRMAGEDKVYSSGNKLLTATLKEWRIRPFICYDLRFPVWTRNYGLNYDVALFVANWPERRSMHWQKLLVARAIENQCFVVGVNRVGRDGHGINFSGDSAVINPMGIDMLTICSTPCIHTVKLSAQTLLTYRKEFPAWMDADTALVDIESLS